MKQIYVIAEAGINHNGSMKLAKQLVDTAVAAKCDAVKFQLFFKEEVPEVWNKIEQYWFSPCQFYKIRNYCKEVGIHFLCSAFGLESLNYVNSFGCWTNVGKPSTALTLKIPSGKIIDEEYLEYAKDKFGRFILSSGMSTLEEIDNALDILEVDRTIVLHCVSSYPTPFEDVNLKAMRNIKWKLGCSVGLSDHTLGTIVPVVAAALGAEVIEKHITLSKDMEGPDHKVSLEPLELVGLVQAIRDVEKILGNGEKKCQPSEKINLHRRG